MKYCPNCHRFSKDDDFCTHCGSAVYDDNSENSIDCSRIPGHTHEKQSFSGSDSYQSNRDLPERSYSEEREPKKKGNCFVRFIFIIIILNVFIDMFFGGIEELFDVLEQLLG